MKAGIVRIGNSKGIRIPKVILEQVKIKDEVDLKIVNNQIVISPVKRPRQGWEEAFQAMAEQNDDKKLYEWTRLKSKWDKREWDWQ